MRSILNSATINMVLSKSQHAPMVSNDTQTCLNFHLRIQTVVCIILKIRILSFVNEIKYLKKKKKS